MHFPHIFSRQTLLKILFVCGCAIVAVIAVEFYLYSKIAKHIPTSGTKSEFTSTGIPQWYSHSSNLHLTPVTGTASFDNGSLSVIESVPSLNAGELIALVRLSGTEGVTLGIVHADQSFTAITTDTSEKADLVESGSTVVFSETQAVSAGSLMKHQLYAFDMTDKKRTLHALGEGRSARFVSEYSIIALAPEGVIGVNLESRERKVLIPYSGADQPGSAVSQDLVSIAFANSHNHTITFYVRDEKNPFIYTFRGILPNIFFRDATFMGNSSLLVLTADDRASLYLVPTAKDPIARSSMRFVISKP